MLRKFSITKSLAVLSLLCFSTACLYAQGGIENWDPNYPLIDVKKLIKSEEAYAKKVEKDPNEAQYYVAMNKFRFIATFTGNERDMNEAIFQSMKNVFQIKTGSSGALNGLVTKEFEFQVGKEKIWMPIQSQMMDAFRKEIPKNEKVLLYTIFTTEHKVNGALYKTFLISEFLAEWTK